IRSELAAFEAFLQKEPLPPKTEAAYRASQPLVENWLKYIDFELALYERSGRQFSRGPLNLIENGLSRAINEAVVHEVDQVLSWPDLSSLPKAVPESENIKDLVILTANSPPDIVGQAIKQVPQAFVGIDLSEFMFVYSRHRDRARKPSR